VVIVVFIVIVRVTVCALKQNKEKLKKKLCRLHFNRERKYYKGFAIFIIIITCHIYVTLTDKEKLINTILLIF